MVDNGKGVGRYSQAGALRGAKHYDQLIKLVFIGDSSVGKTCLLMRFSENRFSSDHMPTIGIDFKIKMLQVHDKRVKLQLWDTAGQERFQTITANYYRGAEGVILVYDASQAQTFSNVRNWLKQIDQNADGDIMRILVANKTDLPNLEVEESEGRALAEQHRMEFYATSAKTGLNVENMFEDIAFKVMTKAQLKKEQQARTQGNAAGQNGASAAASGGAAAGGNVNLSQSN